MDDLLYVWVVECTKDYARRFIMSVHTDQTKALAAVAAYIADGRYGNDEDHFVTTAARLNWTGIKDKAYV